MTKTLHRRGLAATAALTLGLTLLANAATAAEPPKPNFGASAKLSSLGYSYGEGGRGSLQASRSLVGGNAAGSYSGVAVASLASGTLRSVSAVTSSVSCTPDVYRECLPSTMTSTASIFDKVTFSKSSGGDIENISLIPTSMTIDGHFAGTGATAKYRSYLGYDENYDFESLPWIDLTETRTEVLDSLFVPLTTTPLYVYIELMTTAGVRSDGISIADFGNTLHFNWVLPEDMVAHSESGVFMTDVPSAVPEPATWALMITGFGLAGGALRRRKAELAA